MRRDGVHARVVRAAAVVLVRADLLAEIARPLDTERVDPVDVVAVLRHLVQQAPAQHVIALEIFLQRVQ